MCFFLNLGLALKFAIAAWALAVATMLFLEAGWKFGGGLGGCRKIIAFGLGLQAGGVCNS